jgi:glycosyltransferase involved in cell wall biosynthesis
MNADDKTENEARAPTRRVCLVTTEFHGLFRNGGIGTANTALALALAEAGFAVTVAFLSADPNGPAVQTGSFAGLQAAYLGRGISLDHVPPHPLLQPGIYDPRAASFAVLYYLQQNPFDIVLFNDNGGQGFYAMLAKRTGVLAEPPLMIVVAHGPYGWVHELNSVEHRNRSTVVGMFMERRCAALADILISPSQYLIEWMRADGWALPRQTVVIQNLIGDIEAQPRAAPAAEAVRELVFFGRQEIRKGLRLFCDAIDTLCAASDLTGLTITFLGKFSQVDSLHSGIYIAERGRRWPATLRILANADQAEALDYLGRPGVLAVIPSLAENSPCVVAECLQLALPFIATDSGGTLELVAAADRDVCLVPPDPRALAARLHAILPRMPPPASLAVAQAETRRQWLELLTNGAASCEPATVSLPMVSICLAISARQGPDAAWLNAIRQQTYGQIEVLVAGDGLNALATDSGDTELGTTDAGWQIVATDAAELGAARNAAARLAAGQYLLFVAPEALLLPDCVETLVRAGLRTGASLITGLPAVDAHGKSGRSVDVLPLGGCAEIGAFENCFGQDVILVSAQAFRAGAGFARQTDGAGLDWLFLAQQTLAGDLLEVVPQPLFQRSRSTVMPFDAGGAVDRQRRVLHVYRQAPLAVFSRIAEGLLRIPDHNNAMRRAALQHVSTAAQDIAVRLAEQAPNSAEAHRGFIAYCCERKLAALAMDFALLNGSVHVAEAALRSAQVLGNAALAAIRQRPIATSHTLDLTAELAGRVRAVAPLRASALIATPGMVVVHGVGADTTTVKAPATCPPGTRRLRVTVARPVGEKGHMQEGRVQVALAICDRFRRLILAEPLQSPDGGAAWSGWRDAVAGTGLEVAATLAKPAGDLFDIYLLSRRGGAAQAPGPEPKIIWQRATAELLLTTDTTASRIDTEITAEPLPLDAMQAGVLLSDTSDFPFPVFVPGPATLLHPLPGRPAVVRLAAAHPAGGGGLRATVSVDNDQAHPVDFALWICPPTTEPLTEEALAQIEAFSGWHTVSAPWWRHSLSVALPEPVATAMDIYLATRVSRAPDVHFCHASWHELGVLEP